MTREDMGNLWKLLGVYRPGDKHLNDKTLRSAWFLVLEPYSVDDVRSAVADYFRGCKFWPDVTDIARRCPPLPEKRQVRAVESREQKAVTVLRDQWERVCLARQAAGVPATIGQAIEAGMSASEWDGLLADLGLDFLGGHNE